MVGVTDTPAQLTGKDHQTEVYIAFPDGVFHYSCRECTMVCCHRSKEFDVSLSREGKTLLTVYPELEIVAIRRRGDIASFATPSGQCYFVNGDNLCRIETEHGKALKPTGCRLFPFNHYARLGNAVALSPNFLCPLSLQLPARPGEVEGTHSVIEAALRESAYLDLGYIETLPRLALPQTESEGSVLAREREFRSVCSRAIGDQNFCETLRGESADPERFDVGVARSGNLLGLRPAPPSEERDALDDLLFALAPTLRLGMLQLTSEESLIALALGELALRRVAALSTANATPGGLADSVSPKGAFELLTSLGPALRLLSRVDRPFNLSKSAGKRIPSFGDPNMAFAAFRILRAASDSTDLLDALDDAARLVPSVSDRTALFVEIGGRLDAGVSRRRSKQH